jgi:hypothetical protein
MANLVASDKTEYRWAAQDGYVQVFDLKGNWLFSFNHSGPMTTESVSVSLDKALEILHHAAN